MQVVMRLFDAIIDKDQDRILSFFTEQSVLQRQSQEPAIGHVAIWDALLPANIRVDSVERRACLVAEGPDGHVQADWWESRLIGDTWRDLKVSGVLAVNGCKITRWSAGLPTA